METVFQIANSLAFISWILIILLPKNVNLKKVIQYGFIGVLSATYIVLISSTITEMKPDSFSTLANVKALFTQDIAVTAGWIHYLAFDLFVGLYIINEGIKLNMPRWKYTLCLPFTFMFGPTGLLLFYLFKFTQKK
ncbi:MAG: ABA4-like family protein [Crocinitomicaceae bacterium]